MRGQDRKGLNSPYSTWVCVGLINLSVLVCSGCRPSGDALHLATLDERAARRAYDGAPPVIPHEPLGAACTTCHTISGQVIPNIGFAPANPHLGSAVVGSFDNCRQCHVFKKSEAVFAGSSFVPVPQQLGKSQRLFPGAPPVIPHTTLLRENCQACHSGLAARREILCSHPERTNCRQCHVENSTVALFMDGNDTHRD